MRLCKAFIGDGWASDTVKSSFRVSLNMTVDSVSGCDGIYIVDFKMLGHDDHGAVYIVDDEETAIVDTGMSPGVDHIYDALDEVGIEKNDVDYIIPTHVHLDHGGGTGFLADECQNAEVVAHENAVPYLSDPDKIDKLVTSVKRAVGDMADGYGTAKPVDRDRIRAVDDGDVVDLGGRQLEVLHAPGHAPHQICLFDTHDEAIFTADEAGMNIAGELKPTTPPPNFDLEKNLDSLERFKDLDPEVLLYGHYGARHDAVESLEEYSEILRDWVDEVEEVRENYETDDEVVDHFVESDHLYYDVWDDESASETIRMDVEGVLLYLDRQD